MMKRLFPSRGPCVALWCAALGLVALGAGGEAGAQPKYNRKTVSIAVKQTDATKKLEAKKEEPKAPAPEITADAFFNVERAVLGIRDEMIEEYKDLVRDTDDDDPEKADLLFRLAELYAQKQRHFHFEAMEALSKYDRTKNAAEKKKLKDKERKSLAEEKKWLTAAVKIYAAIASNPRFKNYARMDEALFYYAYTLTQAKYDDEARKIYHRLIKDYPNSKYIPDAYLSFAEYYFKTSDLDKAEKFYDKVLEFPKSSVYLYAKYMKGWVLYNQGEAQKSLETWFEVSRATQGDKKQAPLNRAAKKDFVRAYADVGKPEKAYQAFQRVDPKYAFTMLSMLGEFYLAQGKAEKTIYTFRQMISLDAEDQKYDKLTCEWQYTVVRAMLTAGTPQQKVDELKSLLKWYKFLAEGKHIPENNLSECRDNAMATTGELAKIWHNEGLKTLNPETLGYVDKLYHMYIAFFPDADDAPDMQFYYAELMWKRAEWEKNRSLQSQRWEDAAAEYQKVVDMGKVDKKLMKESAYATVLAWKNALAVDLATDPPPPPPEKEGEVPPPVKIPDKEQKMMAAFDVYIKHVTDIKDDELTGIKFLKGRIYWKYRHYGDAVKIFEDILRTDSGHETAEFAANLLLDSLARSNRFEEFVAWVDRMLAMTKFIDEHEELKPRLELYKRQNMRKLAEKLEKTNRHKECGNLYLEIYNKYPTGDDDLAEILYNAAVCFEKARLVGMAIQMRERLTKDPRFATKPAAQKAKFALGLNYASIAYYDQAAERFEEYANKFGGEKNAVDALKNAFFFRKGLGQDDKAMKDINFFIKQYGGKQPKEAAEAFYSMTDIYEKRKAYDDEVKHLSNFLKKWGGKGGVDRQIAAHVKIGEILWRQSCQVRGVNGACIEIRRERALKETRRQKGKKKRSVTQTQCGPASKNKIIMKERKPAIAKQAQQHFKKALALYKDGAGLKDVGGKDDTEKAARKAVATYFAGAATFYLTEDKYEDFLAIKFPEKLDFSDKKKKVKEESMKKFAKWKADKEKSLASAEKDYMHVVNEIKGGGAHWAIASAARVGQLYQNYADALFTAEIPAVPEDFKKLARDAGMEYEDLVQEFVDQYCDTLSEVATPLEDKSITAFSFCLDTSTGLNWFNEWSRLCEGELAQIRPQDFPFAGEIRSDPLLVPTTLDMQQAITEIETAAPTPAPTAEK